MAYEFLLASDCPLAFLRFSQGNHVSIAIVFVGENVLMEKLQAHSLSMNLSRGHEGASFRYLCMGIWRRLYWAFVC